VVIAGTPVTSRGAIALPVENDHWLVIAGGYGVHRPSRDPEEFLAYLAGLPDSAVADTAATLEPVSDIAVYRQTSNQRHHYGKIKNWPDGLLVIGDAACAFNPVYGQGMTVAAMQALLLRDRWGRPGTQRRLDRVADFCWSVATSEDLRHPTSVGEQNRMQRIVAAWSAELTKLAVTGDRRAYAAFAGVYHLMTGPRSLFQPALFVAVAWSRVRGRSQPAPRPAVLDRLRQAQRA
jgi:flavin-dependent dehydrogenase